MGRAGEEELVALIIVTCKTNKLPENYEIRTGFPMKISWVIPSNDSLYKRNVRALEEKEVIKDEITHGD